jgi:hypothetical protein
MKTGACGPNNLGGSTASNGRLHTMGIFVKAT